MSKALRQQLILRLVSRRRVANQEQLRALLQKDGHTVTQSTLSRDIRELGLVKAHDGYQLPTRPVALPSPALKTAVALYLRGCTAAGQLIVLRTAAGHAAPLGAAVDQAELEGVLGSVAGDDTLLLVAPDAETARRVASDLLALAR